MGTLDRPDQQLFLPPFPSEPLCLESRAGYSLPQPLGSQGYPWNPVWGGGLEDLLFW